MTHRALITGGARGIGLAIARRLAADGATIALLGRDAAALQRAANELGARYAVADITGQSALRDAIAAFGACDILVNNAGGALSKPFARHDLADFRSMLDINLLGAVTACQAVLPGMRAQGFGRIINIASTAGLKGYAFVAERVLELDRFNPQIAARLLSAFRSWKMLEPQRRRLAKKTLGQIAKSKPLSPDVVEIVGKMLE